MTGTRAMPDWFPAYSDKPLFPAFISNLNSGVISATRSISRFVALTGR
jgi:hypothetical protein